MADLETLLRDARDKTASETEAHGLRTSLSQLDAELVELAASRAELTKRMAKSSGVLGMLRRGRSDPQHDAVELNRIESIVGALESRQAADQLRLRICVEQSQGAELARAALGAEMKRRTAALSPDDPGRARLVDIDRHREQLVQKRDLATNVATLAAELVGLVDGAEQADDGTDYIFVELQSASRKREELRQFLSQDASIARAMLKDRLEAFRHFQGGAEAYTSVAQLAALNVDDHDYDHEAWLHQVRTALNETVECGTVDEKSIRDELVELDQERLSILTSG